MPRNVYSGLAKAPSNQFLFSPAKAAVSGLYRLVAPHACEIPLPYNVCDLELRLDVDGSSPQNMLSLTIKKNRGKPVHLIARKVRIFKNTFTFKNLKHWGGASPFGSTYKVAIESQTSLTDMPTVVLTFVVVKNSASVACRFERVATSFRTIVMEHDRVEGVQSVISMPAPSTVPGDEPLLSIDRMTINNVFDRAGIALEVSGEHSAIPLVAAGADHAWNRRELHDAMQSYWSHYSSAPQWSMWVLFANLYAESSAVAGMMFDTNKKSQRRGLALFSHSMMFDVPGDEAHKGDWRRRMRFFTLCHEMGHLLNLAHSWEKANGKTWMRLKNAPDALSFMNSPHLFDGGYEAFFKKFSYRFDDAELQFLRHAPEEFVKMGYSAWFENHALSLSEGRERSNFTFELRTGRKGNSYAFMEPVVIEGKIKNISNQTQTIDISDEMLAEKCCLYITCSRWEQVKRVDPYAYGEYIPVQINLDPKKSLFTSLFISAGASEWVIDLPGRYTVQGYVYINGIPVVSNKLLVTVEKPQSRHLESIAADYFAEDVGRVLSFDGSRVMDHANDVLHRCVEPDMPPAIAHHARIALALPHTAGSKKMDFGSSLGRATIMTATGDSAFAGRHLRQLFSGRSGGTTEIANALGNIDFKKYADTYTGWLVEQGKKREAVGVQKTLYDALVKRGVANKDILGTVVKRIEQINSGKVTLN